MEGFNLDGVTQNLFNGFMIDGEELLKAISSGDIGTMFGIMGEAVISSVGQPLDDIKKYLIAFILLGVGAALIKQLNLFFKESQVHQIGFWIVYLLMAREFLNLYYSGERVATQMLGRLLDFGKIFIPVFSAVLTLAAGSMTGTGYVAAVMLIIYVIEQFLLTIMVPLAEGYMLLCILGILWQKDRIEKLLCLLEQGIAFGFKGMFAIVTGLGILQSMILPYVDSTKTGMLKKMIEIIPGAGTIAGNTIEIMSGSAILLKNTIGVTGVLLLVLIVSSPLIKIGLIYTVMRLISAVYGLLGEKQMTWCADKLGMAQLFLLKIAGAGVALFMLWIILAVYTTNQRLIL